MTRLLRCLAWSVALASCAPVPALANEPVALTLYVGQARVLDEPGVRRIVIGNGKVVQATALDERQVLVIPEAPGQSTLHLWGAAGPEKPFVITVLPADVGRLVSEVRALLGEAPNLRVRPLGDKLLLEGENLGEDQVARLAEVVRRYPQVVNLTSKVGAERMIAMDVRMVEIRRDSLENVGVRWNPSAAGPTFGVLGDLKRNPAFTPGGSAASVEGLDIRPRVAPFASMLGIASSFASVINLLVQRGEATILAEPSLSCRSGGSARFLAGGELPIPYSTGLGNTSVVFKEYGVKFDVSPTANSAGVIAARIATEISAVNFDVQVKDIPGISKRRAETEVNLRENETLVIAGLLADESTRSVDQVPALGDLPVLGRLFRSRAFRDRQTELVVFITPRFVGGVAEAPERDAAGDLDAARRKAATVRERADWARERSRFVE
ncbi:MAG: pilus assembly protein N-terminal domain-containing protein [Betaproteobacteria bacterium]|nr:pilus assembly protein N-terminal domain-containing protein [Betaproteobacteria bacterium]